MVSYNSVLDITFDDGEVTEPVQLNDVKNFCKIDISTDDDLILALMTTGRQMCEAFTGVSFIPRDITAFINNENGGMYFPYAPVNEIYSVKNSEGDTLVLDQEYTIKGDKFLRLLTPKETDIELSYAAGYDVLPEVLKTGLLNAIYYLYDNRSVGTEDIGPIAKMILKPYQRV